MILFIPFKVHATSWKFVWQNTTVHVPVGSSIEEYKNVPVANLYRNEILLTDSQVTYNTEGDWMYYFKDIDTRKIGTYQVWYKAYDAKYSPGTCTGYKALVSFVVEDKVSPTITIFSSTIKIKRGMEVNLESNYTAKDNYALESVITSGKVNNTKVGTYPITVVAKDTSGNACSKKFNVMVFEDQAPVISSDLVGGILKIPLKGEADIKSHFQAVDPFDGDISDLITYPPIKNDSLGDYSYTVSVTNSANITSKYTITISVVDETPPTLELTTHSLVLDYKIDFDLFNFQRYIKRLEDNTGINYDNLSISHDLENKIGNYTIWYSYNDGVYQVSDSILVSLVSKEKPEIYVDDIEIYTNSDIDLYDFIQVIDPSDEDILDSLEIYDEKVDYTKEGIYYAEAYCINSSGLSTTKTFKVVVKDNSFFSNDNSIFMIGMIISIVIALGLSIFIIVYIFVSKKRRIR